MQSELPDRYTRLAVVFHWLIAAMVLSNIILAWIFNNVPEEQATPFTNAHKTIGITVLGLAVMRLLWRLTHRPPPFDPAIVGWQTTAARLTHWALYFMIFAMPLSGWIYDSAWEWASSYPISVMGWFEMPRIPWVVNMSPEPKKALDELAGKWHVWLSYVLYFLLAAHLAGAFKHQWLDRVPTLQRMTFRDALRKG